MPAPEFFTPALLTEVLAVSLTAINLLRPLYDPSGGELVDFAVDYLNPAAQRMTGLSERPGVTMRAHFSDTFANGVFDLYRRVFQTGEAGRHDFYYHADGFDNYFQVAARRSGEWLVVSFTDTADHARSSMEEALRESQAREQLARAEAERQRADLMRAFGEAPVALNIFRGPELVMEFANAEMGRLLGRPVESVLGRPVFEAIPDMRGQGLEELMGSVLTHGTPYDLPEVPVRFDRAHAGRPAQGYFHITYRPLHDEHGQRVGVVSVGVEVTDQVLARQQVQNLNEELAALNEELRASNEEYLRANTALIESQYQQRLLNQDLETRVAARTREAQQQRGRLERLVLAAPVAIGVFDGPDWVYQLVNPRYQQLFPGRELLGRRLLEALPELAGQPLLGILHDVYDTGTTFESQEVLVPLARTTDGPVEDLYFDLTYQARYDEAGCIDGFITFATDVTEQVLARRQQETQQHQLRDLFEQAPVAIAVFSGPTYLIDVANPLVAQLWGRTPAQVLGRSLFEALPEVRDQGFRELLDQVVTTGEAFVAQEVSALLERNGRLEKVYLNFVYQPLRDAQGRVTSVAAVATEVGEQVRARQQVQALNEDLAALNEELAAINEDLAATNKELHDTNTRLTRTNADLDTFVYTASHDLKAPIANIEGLLLALRQQLPPATLQADLVPRLFELMEDSVARFQQTIGHLTDISQLPRAEAPETTDLPALIGAVRLDLAPLLETAPVTLTVAVAGCQAVRVAPKTLRSVVYNLLSNAVKYRAPDRPALVQLRAHCTPGHLVLAVQDNGLGLTTAQQGELFGMFRRLHVHVEGSGVGLFMVKRLVENAGGTITVESQPGVGSTFTVSLPA